ncbi:hypothetical protein EMCRGX_G004059 [Ephydatia muelleri]
MADRLSAVLPNFKVYKIPVSAAEWDGWLQYTCARNGWKHTISPLVWRELVDRGGKGLYVGGLDEFVEYSHHYYGIEPATSAAVEAQIAAENNQTLQQICTEELQTVSKDHLVVCVTDAASSLAYHLLGHIASGKTFNCRPVELRLLDTEEARSQLEGVAMELMDMASPLVVGVVCTSSPEEAFENASVAFILGPVDHTPSTNATDGVHDGTPTDGKKSGGDVSASSHMVGGDVSASSHMVGGDLSASSHMVDVSASSHMVDAARTYIQYAQTMDRVSRKDVKILACGGYPNMAVALIARTASSLDQHNIIGASSLLEHKARSIVASKLNLSTHCVGHIAILGRAREQPAVDLSPCQVFKYPGAIMGPVSFSLPVDQCILDPLWIESFSSLLTSTSSTPPVMCEAASISELMSVWMEGAPDCKSVVVGPASSLPGVPEGVAFSLSATCSSGHWTPTLTTFPPHLLPHVQHQGAVLLQELQVVMDMMLK